MKPVAIQITAAEKRFGKVVALRPIDLQIPSGAKVALIGPNGSGKTTLIRVLLGLVRHGGSVLFDGVSVRPSEFARRLGYVPQVAPQWAATCGELVHAVASLRGLPEHEIYSVAKQLELPLPSLVHRSFRTLSGGSKQKLLIALALAPRPDLLILDEPTASLDAAARSRFFSTFRHLCGGATLILCSHRLEEIRTLVDHVVALEDGAVAYSGAAADYLGARVGSLLEVRAHEDRGGWLAAHGFAAGLGGWWSRGVDRANKLALVPQAASALGDSLLDLVVRDVDLLELEREVNHGEP